MESEKSIEEELNESVKRREEMTKENIKKAEQIGFKNIPDKIILADQFGFIESDATKQETTSASEETKEEKQKRLLRENARLEKWNEMLSNFEYFKTSRFAKLKERTRKGIPDSLRGLIWQIYADVDKYRNNESNVNANNANTNNISYTNANVYSALVSEEESDLETESVILRDIDRTFPKHSFFKDKYGLGQRSLFNVLRAYSKYNKETGYVQGMGFIVALMLTYMDEESTFWMIHSLVNHYDMDKYFMKNFPGLEKSFYVLLRLMKKHLTKLYDLFRSKEIQPTIFDILVRIFDVLLLEKEKILYRIALAILKINESGLLACKGFDDILGRLKLLYDNVKVEDLFNKAFNFSISRSQIQEYEAEYEKVKGNSQDEIIKQVRFC